MTEIIASLVFDSWIEDFPELRTSSAEDRHLIYEGGGVILDLLVKKARQGSCVHIGGQVLPDDDVADHVSDLTVVLEQGQQQCCTHTNALGEFSFHSVPNGTFDLAITFANRRFMVSGLSNKEPRMWRVVSTAAGGA